METTTTLEQLVSELFDAFDELYHDAEIAAIATAATVNDLFARTGTPTLRRRQTTDRR